MWCMCDRGTRKRGEIENRVENFFLKQNGIKLSELNEKQIWEAKQIPHIINTEKPQLVTSYSNS